MPMVDHAALPPEEAQRRHEAVVARHGEVLERLRARTAGEVDLDGSRDSLVPLWRWAVARLGEPDAGGDPAGAGLPPWFVRGDDPRETAFPNGMFVLADELGHYLDEVALRTVPGARWRLVGERDGVRMADFQRSGVALGQADLVGPDVAWTMCLRARKGRDTHDTALFDVFRRRVAHVDGGAAADRP
ncbi:hypothetical protein [Aquipuribacter nitratireducens]|uniref:Uncharacterized protein n=1 Tax=Aquipuribacter nitratireducens TaxID=650104 RepID=A0ABW0GS49_9MICO